MATLGSAAWLELPHDPAAAALVAAGGAADGPLRVQYVIGGTPDGEVRYASEVAADGTLTETVGDIADPDVTLTIAYPDAVMCVLDATKDPRFAGNPFVQRDPRVRFYIGAPLVSPCGEALGALCVIDTQSRDGLVPEQADALKALADQVTRALLA